MYDFVVHHRAPSPASDGAPWGPAELHAAADLASLIRAVVLAEVGTHGVLDARLGGCRDGERSLAYPLAGSTGTGDLVIADRGFRSVEFAHVFTVAGAELLVRLQSNHLGTAQEELPDGSYLSMARPGKDVRLRAAREGRMLPKHVIYRVITFAKDDKVAYLGTTLLDPEQYPAAELVALYRTRWEIELAFDEIKNYLGPGGPIRSRTPEGVRQELWAYLVVHHAIRQFAHTAALARSAVDTDRVSYLKCVRIIRRSIPSQLGATIPKHTRSRTEARPCFRHCFLWLLSKEPTGMAGGLSVPATSVEPMGIHCEYVRLSPAELRRSLSDPSWAQEHIDELGDAWAEAEPLPPEKAPFFSIEKAWHKLHHLLTAHGGMPVDVIHGGAELPLEDELDFGPARYLSPEDVARAGGFLAATPFDELARHYDLAAMRRAEIYLLPESDAEVPADLDTLRHRYEELTRFFAAAATAGDAVALMLA